MKNKTALISALAIVILVAAGGLITFKKTCLEAFLGNNEARMTLARDAFLAEGDAKNEVKGARWTKRAAEAGHVPAKALMGVLYLGGIGVDQDFTQAHFWLKQSEDKASQDLAANLAAIISALDKLPPEEKEKQKKANYAAAEADVRKSFTDIVQKIHVSAETAPDMQGEK